MSNIKVNVEGAPEAVAKFFKEMGHREYAGVFGGVAPDLGKPGLMGGLVADHVLTIEDRKGIEALIGRKIPETTDKEPGEVAPEVCPVEVYVINDNGKTNTKLDEAIEKAVGANPSRKPGRQKKASERSTVEGVAEGKSSLPDPEFADLPDPEEVQSEGISKTQDIKESLNTDSEVTHEGASAPVRGDCVLEDGKTETKPIKLKIQDVKESLKEYGIWIVEQGHESSSAKEYLVALLRKFGNGVVRTADLAEEHYEAVFQAAINRVPKEDLEEYM